MNTKSSDKREIEEGNTITPPLKERKLVGDFLGISKVPAIVSWDYIMMVVERIEGLREELSDYETFDGKPARFAVFIFNRCCDIQIDNCVGDHIVEVTAAESKIIGVWQAIILFLKWYNTQSK